MLGMAPTMMQMRPRRTGGLRQPRLQHQPLTRPAHARGLRWHAVAALFLSGLAIPGTQIIDLGVRSLARAVSSGQLGR